MSLSFEAMGRTQSLRLSMRAGRRLEKTFGVSFAKLVGEIEERAGFEFVVQFFAACLEDGRGVKEELAEEILDEVGGLQKGADMIGELLAADQSEKAPEGN